MIDNPSRTWLVVVALTLFAAPALAEKNGDDPDAKLLREHGVGTEPAELLDLLRKLSLDEDGRKEIGRLVRQLGSPRYAARVKAAKALVARGTPALSALEEARHSPDPEVARAAERCVAEINRGGGPDLPAAAVRLLARRKHAAAVPVLLRFAPHADDRRVEREVLDALVALTPADGRPDPALVEALRDAAPARRAAAGYVLGRHKEAELRAKARGLLKDKDAGVRLRAAQGLLRGREKAAVPALIDLLRDAPAEVRWQAEEVLFALAREKVPEGSAGDGGPAALKKWRDAWAGWWAKHGATVDLARLDEPPPFLNLTLVPEMHANKVWEFGPDGKVRWELTKDLQCPIDAQVLPNGRVLVAELNGHRVTERDRDGKILWEHKVKTPIACERLRDGNTFIGTNHAAFVVTPAGKEVFRYDAEQNFFIHSIQRKKNGNIACVSTAGTVREIDTAGKVVRSIDLKGGGWSGIEALPGNRYLVVGGGKVREIDAAGKVLWKLDLQGACYATRLPNGNTLVVNNSWGLVEVDRGGKEVWKRKIDTNLWRVHRR